MFLMKYEIGKEIEDGMFEVLCPLDEWLTHLRMKPRKYDCPGCGKPKTAATPVFISRGNPGFLYNLCCKKEFQGMRFRSYDKEMLDIFNKLLARK